jgi:hypothetical protein
MSEEKDKQGEMKLSGVGGCSGALDIDREASFLGATNLPKWRSCEPDELGTPDPEEVKTSSSSSHNMGMTPF